MTTQKKHMGAGKKVAIGAGVAAAAAAAAGAFFLFGTKAGKKTQKEIKGWAKKAQAEVLEKMKNMKEMNEELYNNVVQEVSAKYKALKDVDLSELEELTKNLKGQWKHIKKALEVHPKAK